MYFHIANCTWDLVPRLSRANIVTGKWIFKYKFHVDGSLDRYKARCVLCGFTHSDPVLTTTKLSVPSSSRHYLHRPHSS
jgi:hypothetical protein